MKVTARARRSGDWWAVDVPEVDGVFTQARRLDQVAEEAADAVATMLDVDPSTVEVRLEVGLAPAMLDRVNEVHELTERADGVQRAASTAIRELVAQLRTVAGLSVRDVGVILGLSHQRVAQLEGTPAAEPRRSQARSGGLPRLGVVEGGKVPAKKSPAKKAPLKKTPLKKAPAWKNAPVRKAPARKAAAKAAPLRKAAAKRSV